jgi:amidase
MSPDKEDLNQEPEPGVSAYALWQLHKAKKQIREEYLALWNATAERTGTGRPADAIISPIGACVAPPHGADPYAYYFIRAPEG